MVPLDEILDTFERLWREKKPRPVLAEFLEQFSFSGSQRTEALTELIAIDMEYHWRAGSPPEAASQADTASGAAAVMADTRPDLFASRPLIEDYAKQWPEILGDNPRIIELMAEEYRIRHRWGDRPPEQEYFRRFGNREELQKALEEVRQELSVDRGEDESPTVFLPPPFEVETRMGEAEDTTDSTLQEFGRYRLLKSLGKGGMGHVYLAEDTQLERRVALKMPHIEEGQALRDRFVNEAKAAAMLRHSGICPVFDAGEIDGQPFLTMAFIEGETLRDHWRRGDRLTSVEMLQLLIEIARAMQIAHAAGIVHRDLKPSNVMIDEHGHPIVMDFGLAYRTAIPQEERITQTGDTLGTPGYMSPEQVEAQAGEIGPATDIYSLGVILFEALTGRLPFTGSVSSILIQIARDAPAAPSAMKKDVDPELDRLCLEMLSKAPADRPQSMREVSDRLTAIQKRLATQAAAPAESSFPVKTSSDRNPRWRKSLGFALAALGIVLALGYVVFRIQTPYGTVTVEVASEAAKDVQVRVLKNGKVIEVADAASGWSLKLEEGDYEFDLGKPDSSFSISPQTLHVSRGEKEIVKVTIADKARGTASQTKVSQTKAPREKTDFALVFDGQDDYVEIPTLTYNGSHPLTIEAWVTAYSRTSYAGIISNRPQAGLPGGLNLKINSVLGGQFWHVGVNGEKRDRAYIWPSDERIEKVKVGERTHIAGVWDGQRLSLFVNGWMNDNMVSPALEQSIDRTDIAPSTASFLLGALVPGKEHFQGAIDEVRFSKSIRYRKDFTPPENFTSDEHTLALYQFEEGSGDILKDSSGHGHDGKIHGAHWVPGPAKSASPQRDAAIAATPREDPPALFFDGANDYVHIPYVPVEGRPPLTIEAWIRPEDDKSRWGKDPSGYIVSTAGFQTGLGLTLAGPMEVMGATIRSPDNQNIGDAVVRPELGEWSHVAAVWTDDALQFYWNGRLKKEWPLDFTQIPGWSSWRLGRRSDDILIGFRGAMREVRISTAARYKDHFRPEWRFEPDEQTLALYHFEEGSGDVLIDSSGQGRYGRHGRIVGAKWTLSKPEVPPEENRALSFDGVDDHVITPIVYDGSHPITVEAWAAAADPWESGTIFSNDNTVATGFKIAHYVHNQNPVWLGVAFGGNSSQPLASGFRRPDHEPKTHLAMVWDKEEFRLYVNGETQQSTIAPLKQFPSSRERIRL